MQNRAHRVAVSSLPVPVPKGWLDGSVVSVQKVPCTRYLQLVTLCLSWPPVLLCCYTNSGSVVTPQTWLPGSLQFVSDGLYPAQSDAAVILHHRLLLAQRDRTSKISSLMKRMVLVLLHVIRSKSGGETALPCEILT